MSSLIFVFTQFKLCAEYHFVDLNFVGLTFPLHWGQFRDHYFKEGNQHGRASCKYYQQQLRWNSDTVMNDFWGFTCLLLKNCFIVTMLLNLFLVLSNSIFEAAWAVPKIGSSLVQIPDAHSMIQMNRTFYHLVTYF